MYNKYESLITIYYLSLLYKKDGNDNDEDTLVSILQRKREATAGH